MTRSLRPSFWIVSVVCIAVLALVISFAGSVFNSGAKSAAFPGSEVFSQNGTLQGSENRDDPSRFEHDFGIVDGGVHAHDFRFKNNEAAPLHVESLFATCACLKVMQSPETIAPGEVGVFALELGVDNVFGPAAQQLTVRFREGKSQVMRLSAFRSGFEARPRQLHLGTVFLGAAGTAMGSIFVGGVPDAAIVAIEPSDKRLTATLQAVSGEKSPLPGSVFELGRLQITLNNYDPGRLGPFGGKIELKTNSIRQPSLSIDVNAVCAGRFEVTPETVFLGSLIPRASVERTATIRSRTEVEAQVPGPIELSSDHQEVTGEVLWQSDGRQNVIRAVVVHCQVKPDSKLGSIQGSLVGKSGEDVLFVVHYAGFLSEGR